MLTLEVTGARCAVGHPRQRITGESDPLPCAGCVSQREVKELYIPHAGTASAKLHGDLEWEPDPWTGLPRVKREPFGIVVLESASVGGEWMWRLVP